MFQRAVDASINCMFHHPPRGSGWGFNQLKIQMPHRLEKSGDQIPSYPLYLETIGWGFDQTKGQVPRPTVAYFIQN